MSNVKRPVSLFSLRQAARSRRLTYCRGQTLVEYALIIAFISVVAISVLISLGQRTQALYTTINSQLARAPGGANYTGP